MRHGVCFGGMGYEAVGERRLMLAVLEDAIRTLLLARGTAVPRRRLLRELAWVESTSHAEPFAFESICDVPGIEPGHLRGRLVQGTFAAARPAPPRAPWTGVRRSEPAGPRARSASF